MTLIQPPAAWKPCTGYVTARSGCGGDRYSHVIDQFQVDSHPRYRPQGKSTFCKTFVWDVTSAMGCEIPHWIDAQAQPAAMGKGAETTANVVLNLLALGAWGWRVSDDPAADATAGRPTVAGWYNPAGIGHVAMVRPFCEPARLIVAQAGRVNSSRMSLRTAFGDRPLVFYAHD
jgi:hypothetical protein